MYKILRTSILIYIFLVHGAFAEERPFAIASAHPLATKAGIEILQQGGNAFDAAITVGAVLAVVEPYSSGIGGGGFWLLHDISEARSVMVDGREKAPLKAHKNMYLDKEHNIVEGASLNGPLAAAIPGMPAALVHLAEHYGELPLTKSLAKAIHYAKEGFAVDAIYHEKAVQRLDALLASSSAKKIFLQNADVAPPVGAIIKQPELANTLLQLAKHGKKGFYEGEVAKYLVDGVRDAGGIWTLDDLKSYDIIERKPIIANYHDTVITTASLPSSGGIVLMEVLNMLEPYDLSELSNSERAHLITEAMRRAYYDRAKYLGDSDFVQVPTEKLLNKAYAKSLMASFSPKKATSSKSLGKALSSHSGQHTTHYSIADAEGNKVAATLSINYSFGAGFVPPGTGVLLNNEMDDFSKKPGVPNVYGLVGGEANAIAPGKRPLSSMTPTFATAPHGSIILGTPGGSRIISMVLLALLNFVEQAPSSMVVSMPRYHHQYLPDLIQYEENAFTPKTINELKALGHKLLPLPSTYGNMQAISLNQCRTEIEAASDPRGIGLSMVITPKNTQEEKPNG